MSRVDDLLMNTPSPVRLVTPRPGSLGARLRVVSDDVLDLRDDLCPVCGGTGRKQEET